MQKSTNPQLRGAFLFLIDIVPGVLPIASIGYKDLSIQTVYIPCGQSVGSALFA